MALREQPWWVRLFAAIGILTTLAAPFTLFFALGRRPSRLVATETPRVSSPDFLVALAEGVGGSVESGGTVKLLSNGDRIFPPLLQDLRGAKKTIHFTVYIWEKGALSDQISDILAERARHGVTVRLLLDSFGASKAPDEQLEKMKNAGVKLRMFREARLGRFTRYYRRSHRRAIVIDGLVGYTGGAAVADKWLGDARTELEWRDDMVRVTGPMARSLQSAFAGLWTGSDGEILVGPEVYPPLSRDGGGTAPPARAEPAEGPSTIQHVGLASSPASDSHPLRLFFGLSFLAARQRLLIASSYFVPD
jgi:cardiolipin synthase